jgi:D-sedoheptulose 7-phosphate isomerase
MQYTKATDYFQSLTSLLLETQITDKAGATLSLDDGSQQAVNLMLKAGVANKMMVVGNGGSAAIASHVHNDLCKAVGVKALVFTEVPLLTALSNDLGYNEAYEQQVRLWATPGDVLIAISSSGQSKNILQAVNEATKLGCSVITFSGFQPNNPLRQLGTLNFYIASDLYGFVELNHANLLHFLTDLASVQRHQPLYEDHSVVSEPRS